MTKEEVLRRWPTEGDFGKWIQCSDSGLHGALHFNGYPPNNQAHSIANQKRNLDGYLFWKLHGWIDNVWEKYRVKTGIATNDTKLQKNWRPSAARWISGPAKSTPTPLNRTTLQ